MQHIGTLIFPGFELTDLFGLLEMFGLLKNDLDRKLITQSSEPIRDHQSVF